MNSPVHAHPKRLPLLALLLLACGTDDPSARHATAAEPLTAAACDFRPDGSRWAPAHARYELASEFGRGDEYLLDLAGIAATTAGDVFVYDILNTRIVRLDRELRPVGAFGRAGRGPGEFSYQRVAHGDWIAADDSSVFVLDLRTLSEFDLTGEFRRYATRELPTPFRIRRIAARDGRVVYVVDDIDRRDGRRALQTWRLEPSLPHTLLRTDSMPALPRAGGRVVTATGLVLHADPLWAAHGRCAFVSDGAGDWILRVDLDADRADTLRLPPRAIPELSAQDEEWLEHGRRAIGMIGNVPRMDRVRPTAPLKWASLAVDPDGFVWLGPWRPPSRRDEPLTAWVIHPATGAVDSVVVPAFPDAFLPDGAFVARGWEVGERVTLVRRYVLAADPIAMLRR